MSKNKQVEDVVFVPVCSKCQEKQTLTISEGERLFYEFRCWCCRSRNKVAIGKGEVVEQVMFHHLTGLVEYLERLGVRGQVKVEFSTNLDSFGISLDML